MKVKLSKDLNILEEKENEYKVYAIEVSKYEKITKQYYLILDDEQNFRTIHVSELEIIDSSKIDLLKCEFKKGIDAIREIYAVEQLHEVISCYQNDFSITNCCNRSIGTRTKTAIALEKLGFTLTNDLNRFLTDESIKINQIQGFLKFANIYFSMKEEYNYAELTFEKTVSELDKLITEHGNSIEYKKQCNYKQTEIYKANYKSELCKFISNHYSFDDKDRSNEHIQDKIIELENELYYLIDSIFVSDINNVFLLEQDAPYYFSKSLVVEYRNYFYSLTYSHYSH